MKWIPKNWKTTLAGAALLLTTASKVATDPTVVLRQPSELVAEVGVGLGLLAARDHNK